ncbi:hypothetical protein ACFWPJ_31925, partial [Nocardia sp. NPDC058497]
AGSPGGLGSPNAGGAVPGLLQSPTTGGQLAGSGNAAGARAAGMPGTGMMPGAGAGAGRKADDSGSEHSSPEYLRGVQPELLDDTHVLAGVIGDDPANELDEPPSNSPGVAESPTRRSSVLDQPAAESADTPPAVTSLLEQPASTEMAGATATPDPTQSAIAPTAPTLPPEIAALLAEHGTPEVPAPTAESERTNR